MAAGKSVTVQWGDGTQNTYTGTGTRTHVYASAGTWTVRVLQPENVTGLDLRDTKITQLTGANISKFRNLTSLRLDGLGSAVVWTVNDAAPMPTGLTSLYLWNLPNLTWAVGSVAGANMPTGLTSLTPREQPPQPDLGCGGRCQGPTCPPD
ncbi:MAG: hypothetical protein KatS3mg051_1943 [Anaerolineae bacterium]|nr:MAG: hypothetical protein KatS3mg051_1943 [Anaerolineae bacterium]